MTFVYAVSTPKTAWLLVDRRLSWPNRMRDDAIKLLHLDTSDGLVLVGYAGLGLTPGGTEPSEWMARTIRGIDSPLEQTLEILTNAAERRLPEFLRTLDGYHVAIAVGFLNGEPRIYPMTVSAPPQGQPKVQLIWHTTKTYRRFGQTGLLFASAGSGAGALPRGALRSRELMRLFKAHDRGALTSRFVARKLAGLNRAVAAADRTNRVSDRCIVAWRHQRGGGGHVCFSGDQREPRDRGFPTMSRGQDIRAGVGAMLPHILPHMEALRRGQPPLEIDGGRIDADLARLPNYPDDSLN